MAKYKKTNGEARPEGSGSPIRSMLDQLILLGAQKMIEQGLEAEIQAYLGRQRYERHENDTKKQYRNGYSKERQLTASIGSMSVRAPRLRETFESQILGRYQRLSGQMQALVPDLYLHGLSSGDFQQCFQGILGPSAPLSQTSVLRMKKDWEAEYQLWKKRRLEKEYLYVWADGVYPKAGPKDDSMAVLVLVGVRRNGEKEILALEEGYRESAESWCDLLRNIKKRGVEWIGMVIADGALGLWKALRDVFPTAKRQRCWIHKMRNVLDKVSARHEDEVRELLRQMYHSHSADHTKTLMKMFRQRYYTLYPKAVECLEDQLEMLLTYFQFPKKHWRSIKSTNVIESMFSTVKLRTNAARRIPRRDSALYLVFKLLTTLQTRLKKLHGYKLVAQTIDLLHPMKHSKLRLAA
jgi:Transposase and inactivated derivatives